MDVEPPDDQLKSDEHLLQHSLDVDVGNIFSVKEETIEDVHELSDMQVDEYSASSPCEERSEGSVTEETRVSTSAAAYCQQDEDLKPLADREPSANDKAALINRSADQDEDHSMDEELFGSSLNHNQVSWIKNHNEDVKNNREVFKILMGITSFACQQKNVFIEVYNFEYKEEEDEEEEYSLDPRILKYCLESVAFEHPRIKEHWDNKWYFAGLIKNIELQNQVINFLYDELWSYIETSIREAPFFACILDEADFNTCSVTVRLVDSDGEVREYFIGFYTLNYDRTANGICKVLRKVFEKFNIKNQLVAQSYDGHCLLTGDLGDILTKTQKIVPQAMLTHNSSHHLYHILNQSCSQISMVDSFWYAIDRLPVFLHHPRRKKALEKVLGDVFPTYSEICMDSYPEIISKILTNRQKLIEVLQELAHLRSPLCHYGMKINIYKAHLEDFSFVFLLYVFQNIFDETEDLLIPVQKMSNDSVVACIHNLKSLKNDEQFEEFMQLTEPETGPFSSSEEFVRLQKKGINPTEYLKKMYFDLLDDVTAQLDARFSRCEELSFLQLGDARKFARYYKRFPTQALNSLMNSFGDRFNEERLKLELETIFSFYQTNRSKTARLSKMIKQMANDGRKESLPEAFKLFTLIATIPASKLKSGSTFSRIQSYMELARHLTEERCSALALVSIEKEILLKVQNRESWYDDIVERFAKMKERLIPLLYK